MIGKWTGMVGVVCCALVNIPAHAEPPATAPAEPVESKGLIPVPDYTGDFWSRSRLTGDWGGARTDLADKGIQFDVNWTQAVQSVVDGGSDTGTKYGGNLDYLLNLDLMRMDVLPGALVKIRAETRYGESVNGMTGAILPVNTDAFFPVTSTLDEDIPITVTDLNYTQFLGPHLAVLVGKIDTLDGDPNEFASGRGTSQFLNANFIFNSALALRLPYSTLGVGVVWMPVQSPKGSITVTNLLMNTLDSSTTSGFGDIGDGATWNIEADFQYRLGHLPGGQNLGFLYSFDQDFAQVSGDFIFEPGQGLLLPQTDSTWAVYWSGWQYLFTDAQPERPLQTLNGEPDLQGVGLFARVGFADQDTNPIQWTISGGVGGRGIIPCRLNDTFGVGYFYTKVQTSTLTGFLGLEDHAQGFEAFYNISVTPACHVTLDIQAVETTQASLDPAVILGLRARLDF